MWIFGAIAIAAVIAVVAVVVIDIRDGTSSSSRGSRKADITELTTSMLVDQSSFPAIEGGRFIGPKKTNNPLQGLYSADPPECSALFAPKAAQSVVGGLTDGAHIIFNLNIGLLIERLDYKSVASKCRTFRVGNTTNTVTQRSLPGLPDWAIAVQPATSPRLEITELDVMGYYRGLLIEAGCRKQAAGDASQEDIASLVKVFNDQVAKLEAAP